VLELQAAFGYRPFTRGEYRRLRGPLTELALQTAKGPLLTQHLIELLRQAQIILPTTPVLDRLCGEALTRGTRLLHRRLTEALDAARVAELDRLLVPAEGTRTIPLTWLRQPPGEPNAKHVLEHLERLARLRAVGLSADRDRMVHQGRLTQLAREGSIFFFYLRIVYDN